MVECRVESEVGEGASEAVGEGASEAVGEAVGEGASEIALEDDERAGRSSQESCVGDRRIEAEVGTPGKGRAEKEFIVFLVFVIDFVVVIFDFSHRRLRHRRFGRRRFFLTFYLLLLSKSYVTRSIVSVFAILPIHVHMYSFSN